MRTYVYNDNNYIKLYNAAVNRIYKECLPKLFWYGKDIIFVKKMEDRELIEKCINYFKEEYKIYISDYQWITYYANPDFDFWIPDAIFYIEDLNKTGLAIKINQNKETCIKDDIVKFNDKNYICVDINNFDDFVKIFTEHFKKIDIWEIIGKKEKETLEIGF